MTDSVRIQKNDFNINKEIELLKNTSLNMGGIVAFLGSARNLSKWGTVKHLDFEEYEGMALRELKKLSDYVKDIYDILDIRIIHRVTRLYPGEDIVLIIVGAVHRDVAFKACSFAIDELKKTVPIWKKESTQGRATWITPHP